MQDMYPVSLRLDDQPCLVVGGGRIAIRKTRDLLRCGARVTVVAEVWREDFHPLALEAGAWRLTLRRRAFESSDLGDVILVIAATDDRDTQERIARCAAGRKVLCNVVDVSDLGSFFVPATLRRGSLTISVSTEGRNPLFAVALRDRLAASLAPEIAEGIELLGEGREIARARHAADPAKRREALGRLVPPEAVKDLIEGRLNLFKEHWRAWRASLAD